MAQEKSHFTSWRSTLLRQSHEAMEATQMLRVMQPGFEQQAAQQQQWMEAVRQQEQLQLQQQHEERQQQTKQPQGAPQTAGIERQSQQQQLNMRGFDNIETLLGGEDQWQSWSWTIKTAVSGMNGNLAGLLNAAETGGVRIAEEILKEDERIEKSSQQDRLSKFCTDAGFPDNS